MKRALLLLLPVLVVSLAIFFGLDLYEKSSTVTSDTVNTPKTYSNLTQEYEGTNSDDLNETYENDTVENNSGDSSNDTVPTDDSEYDADGGVQDSSDDRGATSSSSSSTKKTSSSGSSSSDDSSDSDDTSDKPHVRDNTPKTADLEVNPRYILCMAFAFAGMAVIIISRLRREQLINRSRKIEEEAIQAHEEFRRREHLV